jgi:hypothetical protein
MIPSWSFAHVLILLWNIIEQLPHLCTCPVLPDQLYITLVATLANGCIGYVGTRDVYNHIAENGVPMVGGYETMPSRSSRCEQGTGELIADRAVALINSMWKVR